MLTQIPLLTAGALLALAMVTLAGLRGWQGWLALKTREIELIGAARAEGDPSLRATGQRIELADLKERIRKLEAIAAGVDL